MMIDIDRWYTSSRPLYFYQKDIVGMSWLHFLAPPSDLLILYPVISMRETHPSIPICSMYGIFTYMTGWFLGQMLINIPYMEHMGSNSDWSHLYSAISNWTTGTTQRNMAGDEAKKHWQPHCDLTGTMDSKVPSGYVKIAIENGHL